MPPSARLGPPVELQVAVRETRSSQCLREQAYVQAAVPGANTGMHPLHTMNARETGASGGRGGVDMVQAGYQLSMRTLHDTPFNTTPNRRVLGGVDGAQAEFPSHQLHLISPQERMAFLCPEPPPRAQPPSALHEALQAWQRNSPLDSNEPGSWRGSAVLPAADAGMHSHTRPGTGSGTGLPRVAWVADFTILGVPERSPFKCPRRD